MSYGWSWVYKGFASSWSGIRKIKGFKHFKTEKDRKVLEENILFEREGTIQIYGFKQGLGVWKEVLKNLHKNTKQIKLENF